MNLKGAKSAVKVTMGRTQKQINKSNRKRGSKFEKTVADFLDMDVVPYSGSNARFGYGDIRDSIWLGECKNITMKDGRVCIKREWFIDNQSKATSYDLIPYLAWMPSGRATKYIMLEPPIFSKLDRVHDIIVEIPKKAYTAVNIFIDVDCSWVKSLKMDAGIARIVFGDWTVYMMRIELFKDIIGAVGLKGRRQAYDLSTGDG